jgi:hypothetical protein
MSMINWGNLWLRELKSSLVGKGVLDLRQPVNIN